jgi:peroxiredoxin
MSTITRESSPLIAKWLEDSKNNQIHVGSLVPNVTLTRYNKNTPPARENFRTGDLLEKHHTIVFFTTPRAFTPTCTGEHLAGFKEAAQKILDLGVHKIICIVPNGVDEATAWNKLYGDPERIDIWADNEYELTLGMGLGLDMSGNRGEGLGVKRTAFIVNQGVIVWLQIEESAANCSISHATSVINYLASRV